MSNFRKLPNVPKAVLVGEDSLPDWVKSLSSPKSYQKEFMDRMTAGEFDHPEKSITIDSFPSDLFLSSSAIDFGTHVFPTMAKKPMEYDRVMRESYCKNYFKWYLKAWRRVNKIFYGIDHSKAMCFSNDIVAFTKHKFICEKSGKLLDIEVFGPRPGVDATERVILKSETKRKKSKNCEAANAPITNIYVINGDVVVTTWELEIMRRTENKDWLPLIKSLVWYGIHRPLGSHHEWLRCDLNFHRIPHSPTRLHFYDHSQSLYDYEKRALYATSLQIGRLPKVIMLPRQNQKPRRTEEYLRYLFHNHGLRKDMYYHQQQEYLRNLFWDLTWR